jgi:hypothetical protein
MLDNVDTGEWGAETGVNVGSSAYGGDQMISGSNSNAIYEASFMEEIYLQQGWPLSQIHQLWVQGQNQGNACYFTISLFVAVSLEATIVEGYLTQERMSWM